MKRPWFDPETDMLLIDEYVSSMPSFQKVMADQVVTDQELEEQADRTVEVLKKLEGLLSAEEHAVATQALCELAVLLTLQQLHASRVLRQR